MRFFDRHNGNKRLHFFVSSCCYMYTSYTYIYMSYVFVFVVPNKIIKNNPEIRTPITQLVYTGTIQWESAVRSTKWSRRPTIRAVGLVWLSGRTSHHLSAQPRHGLLYSIWPSRFIEFYSTTQHISDITQNNTI